MKTNLMTFAIGNLVAYKNKLYFEILENFGNDFCGELEVRSFCDNDKFVDMNGNPIRKLSIHTIKVDDFNVIFRKVNLV